MNGSRIRNSDDVASYLEENTLPGNTVVLTVRRESLTYDIPVVLGRRPQPSPPA